MTYTYGCTNFECWGGGIPRAAVKITEEVKTLVKAIKYICLQMETRGDPLDVTYEHVTKRVAKVKSCIYRRNNPSSRME